MKRVLYVVVSAVMAVASYTTFATQQVFSKVTSSSSIVKQQQDVPLILEQFSADADLLAAHYSHSSHRSHSSHSSHRSHSSHYSSR